MALLPRSQPCWVVHVSELHLWVSVQVWYDELTKPSVNVIGQYRCKDFSDWVLFSMFIASSTFFFFFGGGGSLGLVLPGLRAVIQLLFMTKFSKCVLASY